MTHLSVSLLRYVSVFLPSFVRGVRLWTRSEPPHCHAVLWLTYFCLHHIQNKPSCMTGADYLNGQKSPTPTASPVGRGKRKGRWNTCNRLRRLLIKCCWQLRIRNNVMRKRRFNKELPAAISNSSCPRGSFHFDCSSQTLLIDIKPLQSSSFSTCLLSGTSLKLRTNL